MTEVSTKNFGYLIAYVIPGFIVVATAGTYSTTVRSWLGAATDSPTVGGFLYVTLASVAVGMAVSALRWLVLDTIHHHSGVPRPVWDVATLATNLTVFEAFVEYHYRHYLFYSNTLVALLISLTSWRATLMVLPLHPAILAAVMLALILLFFVASRDALQKYYARTNVLLISTQAERRKAMVNGCHSEENEPKTQEQAKSEKTPTASNTAEPKPTAPTKDSQGSLDK